MTPSREDPFSIPSLGAHFFVFGTAFSRKVTILSPNLDPGGRGHHVTFHVFFRLGPKRDPRRNPEVPKATKKRPWGSQGVPKREPRKCPGYSKKNPGDLFRARWREGRRQLDIITCLCAVCQFAHPPLDPQMSRIRWHNVSLRIRPWTPKSPQYDGIT